MLRIWNLNNWLSHMLSEWSWGMNHMVGVSSLSSQSQHRQREECNKGMDG